MESIRLDSGHLDFYRPGDGDSSRIDFYFYFKVHLDHEASVKYFEITPGT